MKKVLLTHIYTMYRESMVIESADVGNIRFENP